ncbi:hypothetical protein FH972_023772 [Carpinus fangiana]|uniref:DUF6603 domain-containing protein n=1 Tax=Carpinus fangiana TaxID=176857 RepID=A0A5N6KWM9_9ROSI|nr:hypothetical protein FH972_023772 [Carpinus fangiana]
MATLHCAMIGLSGDPSEINQGSSIQLNEQDELSFWFQDVFNTGPSNVLMIRSADPASGYIGGFAISMPLVPLRKTLSTTDSPVVLLFTTAEGALNNTFDGSTPPSMGLRDGSTALTMALDNTSREPTSVTLEVLSRFVGLESLFENGVLSTLKNLNFVIPDPKNPGKGHRNALWFVPQQAYATTLRLQLDLSTEDLVTLQSFLDILNGTVTSAYIIARRKSIWMSNSAAISFETRGEMVLVTEMTIAGLTFDVVAEFSSGSVQFDVILKRKDGSVLDKMLNWLKTTFITDGGDDPFPFTQWLTQSAGPVSFPSFDFRRVAVVFSQSTSDSSKLKFRSFALDMELRMQINDQTVLSLIDFTYAAGSGGGPALTAELWTAPSYDVNDPALRLIPDFENYAWFEPLEQNGAVQDWPRYIDLKKLTGFGDSSPSIFPTLLSMAKFYIDKNTVAFSGTLRSVSSEEKSKPPIFAIDMIDLAASYTFGSGKDAAIDCMLGVSASIQAPPETKLDAAELKGGFAYEGARERWILSGSIENLCGAHFYQFFDSDSRSAAASLLDNIAVKRFDITYIYTAGQASDLDLKGTLGIGKLDFDLWYKNRGSGDWEFDASVTFGTGEAESTTLGEMLANVVGENDFNIPDFLGNITVSRKSSEDIVALKLCPDSTKTHLFFTMWVKLGDLRIQYIQFTPLKQQTGATATPSIKRVFLASIDALPKINIPVLGDITQPFDEALALWVQPQLNSEGLTLEDVNSINDLITKAPLSQKALPHKPNTGLRNGVHLMLVLKDNKGDTNVVVDYIFGDKKPDSTALLTGEDEFPSENGESGMATYSKSYGGLSVRNVGLKYTGSILSIKVDAAVKFGPIDFALLGFTIDLDFSSEARASLFNLPKPSISIQGLEAGYNSPPVVVGGMLLHVSDEKMDLWQGALAGSFQPWAFAVAGCYGTIKDLEAYKTFFLYARLLGPLITFEFATITGVTAGFGYNSSMQFPAVSDITKYPLLSVPDPPKDAQTAIQQLTRTAWFKGKNNSFWIAAGLDVNAFQMLDVSAVLAIEFDPNVKIGLFAIGTAVIPNEKAGKAKFAQIQLALTAVIDFAAGTMKIDGQLTPASFILDPNCHLTGGFGLYTWFGDAAPELKGDWVFTIGGYHRLFKPPPQYPHPPRLGISWQFNNAISIRGEAYFAITPKVCMGGGRWDVSLRLGPLEAYYSAFVDFLISFKPFYFIADGGVTVGVRYTMDLWLVTLRISVELSATLHIEGPPIHGYVHVDFWVFGFNIAFGDSSSEAQKLSLKEFLDLACQVSESAASDMFQTILGSTPVGGPLPLKTQERTIGDQKVTEVEDDAREPHVLVVQSGLVPDGKPESRPSGGPWTVRAATFSFAVSCKVALSKATIITGKLESSMTDDDDAEAESVVQGTGNSIYARPMCDESAKPDLGTELFVTIKPVESKQKLLADGTTVEADIPEWNDNSGIVKNLPTGLWGKYDRSIDPRRNPNASSLLDGNKEGTVSLLCGVVVRVPKSLVSVADTTKPFDYKKFMVQEIGGQYGFAKLRPNEAKFLPAPPEGKTQWDSVKSAWKSPGMGGEAPITVVDMWQDMGLSDLGWDPAKVDTEATGRWP